MRRGAGAGVWEGRSADFPEWLHLGITSGQVTHHVVCMSSRDLRYSVLKPGLCGLGLRTLSVKRYKVPGKPGKSVLGKWVNWPPYQRGFTARCCWGLTPRASDLCSGGGKMRRSVTAQATVKFREVWELLMGRSFCPGFPCTRWSWERVTCSLAYWPSARGALTE